MIKGDPDTKIPLKANKTHFVQQLLWDKWPGELENKGRWTQRGSRDGKDEKSGTMTSEG